VKTAKFLIALFFAVVAISSLAEDTNVVPKNFKAYIGGFGGPSYTVELQNGVLVYSEDTTNTLQIKITPTLAQWQEFRHDLDDLQVWQWQSRYDNPRVCDGTQWSLLIDYPDKHLETGGGNSYPDAVGKPNKNPELTKTFHNYLAAVQKLLGGKDFK